MNKLLKDLYDCFYFPPELPAQKQEIEECHQALIEVLEKPERRWCCRSSTPKTALWKKHPSTALSLDLRWRGGSPQN